MENKPAPWPEHFGLTSCAASAIDPAIPAKAWGVAVIYAPAADRETVFLVLESRAGSLRELCAKRLGTAKLPAVGSLRVAFKAEALSDPSPAAVHAACRQQLILAGELRRTLRPAMR